MTQAWSSGYVADVTYIEGFYPAQSPARMALACLLNGVTVDMPRPDDPVHYLELGCGVGIGALLMAAANPDWQVTAVDYNPAHIAIGAGLARAAQLDNIRFIEADLATLAESHVGRAIPTADFVSMHGVWSWVGPDVRRGIVRLLAEKSCPGALVHLSYNAMPAWQGGIGMQRLIYEAGMRAATRSDRRADAGLNLARDLKEAGGQYLNDNPLARELLASTTEMSREYLSHEYMNAHWAPAFHADVAAAMADAKLDWVGSANPLENFNDLMLTGEQREIMNRYEDPLMRELIKDICMARQLRHDVYVRGVRRIGTGERDAALAALTITPVIGADELKTALRVPAGTAEMSEALAHMMAAAMRGTTTIAALLAEAPGRSNPPELLGVLVGSSQCQIVVNPHATQPDGADRLNRVLGARIRSVAGPKSAGGLASAMLGTGFLAQPLVQFIAGRLLNGEREDQAEAWIAALSADILPEKRETVRDVVQTAITQRVPILRRLRIVPD